MQAPTTSDNMGNENRPYWSGHEFIPSSLRPSANENTNNIHPRFVQSQTGSAFHLNDMPIRPESSVSNVSFVSQTNRERGDRERGGVSLNHLMGDGRGVQGTNGAFGLQGLSLADVGVANVHIPGLGLASSAGYTGRGGKYAHRPDNSLFARTDVYKASHFDERSTHPVRPARVVAFPTKFDSAPVSRHQQAIGSSLVPLPSITKTLPDNDRDSARGHGGSRRAYDLAEMIKTGGVENPDEWNTTLAGDDRSRPVRTSTAMPHGNMRRSTRSTHPAGLAPSNNALSSTAIVSTKEGNIKGMAAIYIGVEMARLPVWYDQLPSGLLPTLETFFDSLPVIEAYRYAVPSTAGVIRIRNIPFATPRSEITAFVGRNAQIVSQPEGSPYHAVHVIMERHTGKTMDAFIELARISEATYVVSQFQRRLLTGRAPKVGNREVEVELSSQEELMAELFPRAKNVRWVGAEPVITDIVESYYPGTTATGFNGFLQDEEVVMAVKHADTPHRSPFAQRCMLRVYESWISTLHKYPWFSFERISMIERRKIFDATLVILRALISFLRRTDRQAAQMDNTKPTANTLQELTVAALTCPGFSEQQKSTVVNTLGNMGYGHMASGRGMAVKFGGNAPVSNMWPFAVLSRDPRAADEMITFFASLMREATTGGQTLTLAQKHQMRASSANSDHGPFGVLNIDYGNAKTMDEVGKIELNYIESALGRVLPHA